MFLFDAHKKLSSRFQSDQTADKPFLSISTWLVAVFAFALLASGCVVHHNHGRGYAHGHHKHKAKIKIKPAAEIKVSPLIVVDD